MEMRKMLVIKLGNNERPACEADIADMARIIDSIKPEDKDKLIALVTHHAVQFEVLEIPADTEIKVFASK